ncbi:MAG: hypothetical protein ACI3XF_02415 [Eubacteriales bacterium]
MNRFSDRGSTPLGSTITRADELCIIWYRFVFAINVEIPQRK